MGQYFEICIRIAVAPFLTLTVQVERKKNQNQTKTRAFLKINIFLKGYKEKWCWNYYCEKLVWPG